MPTNLSNIDQTSETDKKSRWWHPLLAGWVAGTIGGYLCYIFEQAKKRAESGAQQHHKLLLSEIKQLFQSSSKQTSVNVGKAIKNFIAQSSKGIHSFGLTLAPVSMLQVSINNYLLHYLKRIDPQNESNIPKYVAGLVSGGLGALVSSPVEHFVLIQQREQCGVHEAYQILSRKGSFFAWTGFKPLVVRESIFGFTMLVGADAFGDWIQSEYLNHLKREGKTPTQNELTYSKLMGQLMVGVGGSLSSHPFDVIATWKQMRYQTSTQLLSEPSKNPLSTLSAVKEIFAKNGVKGFWHGGLYRIGLFTGCMLTIGNVQKRIMKTLEDVRPAPSRKPVCFQYPRFEYPNPYDIPGKANLRAGRLGPNA